MRHARDANELFEVASDELWSVVGDNTRPGLRVLLFGSLQDQFDFALLHLLSQIPMHHETTVAIQYAAQVLEGPAEVDVGDIDMPMFMRLLRLLESAPFARWLRFPSAQQASLLQYPPNTRRTHRYHIRIEHHERQPPVAF